MDAGASVAVDAGAAFSSPPGPSVQSEVVPVLLLFGSIAVLVLLARGVWKLSGGAATHASHGKRRPGEQVLSAKYGGRCSDCGRPVVAGTRILWMKGAQPRHEDCAREAIDGDADVLLRAVDKLNAADTPAARTRVVQQFNAKLYLDASRQQLLQMAAKAGIEAEAAADAELLTKTIAKLETAKGQATRARVLEAALAETKSTDTHARLLLEASRINARAILDKVDTLKSNGAKRRHLTEAIAAIKNDPVPDEMQADEISWLETALKGLDDQQDK